METKTEERPTTNRVFAKNFSICNKLQPLGLWKHFPMLCQTPRETYNEAAIAKHIADMAAGYDYEVIVDARNSVLVRLPATPGYEHLPVLCLQSHLDMVVSSKDETTESIFPVQLQPVGSDGILRATGTTLGADNGMGVAAMLMVMTEKDIPHGRLELLFTAAEEKGLEGATDFDYSQLKAKKVLNLDSEDGDKIFVGCAGGARVKAFFGMRKMPETGLSTAMRKYAIEFSGFTGGHSGIKIHLGLANAITVLAEVLLDLGPSQFLLNSFSGGEVGNSIPKRAKAEFLFPAKFDAKLAATINNAFSKIRQDYPNENPSLFFKEVTEDSDWSYYPATASTPFLQSLVKVPNGVLEMEGDSTTMTKTSNNVGLIELKDDQIVVTDMYRSLDEPSLQPLENTIVKTMEEAGATVVIDNRYLPWKPQFDTALLNTVKKVSKDVSGEEYEVTIMHAGLETAVMFQKMPIGTEFVSVGPKMDLVHTPDEWVDTNSVSKFADLVKGILVNV